LQIIKYRLGCYETLCLTNCLLPCGRDGRLADKN
jgi:hypothetical protein